MMKTIDDGVISPKGLNINSPAAKPRVKVAHNKGASWGNDIQGDADVWRAMQKA